jgi:hypothetical protein
MIYKKTHSDKKALNSHISKIKDAGGNVIVDGLSVRYFYPSNTIGEVRLKHKSWKKTEKQEVLFIVLVSEKDKTPYYSAMYFPKWVEIGGVYGNKNDITIIEKF